MSILFQQGSLFQQLSLADLITGLLSLLSAGFTAWIGYLISVKKIGAETRLSVVQAAKTAEQEFQDNLMKQLEDSAARLDRQMQRLDEREKRNLELLAQIDSYWNEKAELKSRIATLEAELSAAHRKIRDLTAELEKFERKVFYIAKQGES